MKARLHPLLSLLLVLVAVAIVGCGGSGASEPPTYSEEMLQTIDLYATPVKIARRRMPELSELIEDRSWVDVDTFIHGPYGQLRRDLSFVTRSLLPEDQERARDLAQQLATDLERIDAAADERDYAAARGSFGRALDDFDAYLDLVPTEAVGA